MFPVPSHLPQKQGEEGAAGEISYEVKSPKPDTTLDLLSPYLESSPEAGPSRWSSKQAITTRQSLEKAVKDNKAKTHQLLLDNFANVSSHIHLSSAIRTDHARIQSSLGGLEAQIDPNAPETSFLPPVLRQLNRHFSATTRQSRARSHLSALRELKRQAEQVEKLEQAIWSGHGADESVVRALCQCSQGTDDGALQGTKIAAGIKSRRQLFHSMVVEQVTDAVSKAIVIIPEGTGEAVLRVTAEACLQRPRIPRPEESSRNIPTTNSTTAYSLSHLLRVLSNLGSLSSSLSEISTKLLKHLIRPLLGGVQNQKRFRITQEPSQIKLVVSQDASPSSIISDLGVTLDFLSTSVIPPSDPPIPERQSFLTDLHSSVSHLLLDLTLIPSMPKSIPEIPAWLDVLQEAVLLENKLDVPERIIQPFTNHRAGAEWAETWRRQVSEDVIRLVHDVWGSWEAREAEREREVTVMMEVEEDVPREGLDTMDPGTSNEGTTKEQESGWNFDASKSEAIGGNDKVNGEGEVKDNTTEVKEGEGWDFEEPVSDSLGNNVALVNPEEPASEGDGWDFEMPDSSNPPPPAPPVLPTKSAKPVREAKKLGKKLAKAKAVDHDEMESIPDSPDLATVDSRRKDSAPSTGQAEDGWGWEDPVEPASSGTRVPEKAAKPEVKKRKVLREEKRVVKESYLISKACGVLLEMAERALHAGQEIRASSLPAPFMESSSILDSSASEIFDIFRALIFSTYSTPIRDVPTLAMQLSNDFTYLSSSLSPLGAKYSWDTTDLIRRLEAASEHAAESQVAVQRENLMELLDETEEFEGTGSEEVYRKYDRILKEVEYNLDSLGRVFKVVMPHSSYLEVMGYLVDIVIQRICSEVLALPDITEIESNRLNDLLRLLHPLDKVFADQPDQPSAIAGHVPHWLKFCYISELLQANLVDITYLFDTGALVDFTTQELVNLIKALFADSEKRDTAIERIERSAMDGTKGQVMT